MKSSNTGELYFDDVRVPAENILGTRGQGFKIMMERLIMVVFQSLRWDWDLQRVR